jgi:hypothetical protein
MIVAIVPLILASSFIFCSLTFCKYLIFTSSPDSAAEIIQLEYDSTGTSTGI